MTKIFADSNFFIGLFNPADSLHKKAINTVQRLDKTKVQVYFSNLIFSEVVTVLSQKTGKKVAVEAGEELLKPDKYSIVHVGEDLSVLTWDIFQGISKKNMSFVDCSSIAIMQTEGINKFLTFDEEDFSPLRKKYSFSFY